MPEREQAAAALVACSACGLAMQDSDECRMSGLCLPCLVGPPPPPPSGDYECCASGSCEVCGGFQGLIRLLGRDR